MSSYIGKRFFIRSHEWMRFTDWGSVEVGISDHAQRLLGELVAITLPEVGDYLTAGEAFGSAESVKAVTELYAPVTAMVTEINETLLDDPQLVNRDAFGTWLFRANDVIDHGDLLDEDEYNILISE